MDRTFRLPNGDTTQSPTEYLDAWHRSGNVVERLLHGYVLDAFDPDFRFTCYQRAADGKVQAMSTITFSADAIEKLNKSADRIKEASSIISSALVTMLNDTKYEALAVIGLRALKVIDATLDGGVTNAEAVPS